jgi:hypothetical protein
MRVYRISVLFFIAANCLGCKKNSTTSNTTPADKPGNINITAPVSGTIYDNNFTLITAGDMSDDNVLTSAKVEVRNKITGAILFQQTTSTGNVTFYRFQWSWIVTGITAPFTATVKVTATDSQSNQTIKEVDIILSN